MGCRLAAAALWLATAACDLGGTDPTEPVATLGTGVLDFEPLADGDTIQIIQGPQGGYHFLGSVRVEGIDPGDSGDLQDPTNPTTEFMVFAGGRRMDIRTARYTQGLKPADPSAGENVHEMVGRLVILDIARDSELDGVEVEFSVTVTGADGTKAEDARTLIAVPHPQNI